VKDFNLFVIYSEKSSNIRFGYGIGALVVIIAVALPILYRYTLNEEAAAVKNEAEAVEKWLNLPSTDEQLAAYDAELAYIETIKIYANALEDTVIAVEKTGALSSYNLTDIADVLPLSVNIENFSYSMLNVEMLLAFPEPITAAETLNLLKQAEYVDRVQLKSINEKESDTENGVPYYEMAVSVQLKEGVLR